jgi:hypothetical protein
MSSKFYVQIITGQHEHTTCMMTFRKINSAWLLALLGCTILQLVYGLVCMHAVIVIAYHVLDFAYLGSMNELQGANSSA